MEKTAIGILSDISKREGWEITFNEKVINVRYGHTDRSVVIRNPDYKDLYFLSVKNQTFGKKGFYSGIFCPLSGFDQFHLYIRKRDALDKLNFKQNKLRFKIGNHSFDSKLLVKTNQDSEAHKILSSSGIQYDLIHFVGHNEKNVQIGMNEINPDFTNELKGRKYLSAFLSEEWMLDHQLIEASFKITEKIKNRLINK